MIDDLVENIKSSVRNAVAGELVKYGLIIGGSITLGIIGTEMVAPGTILSSKDNNQKKMQQQPERKIASFPTQTETVVEQSIDSSKPSESSSSSQKIVEEQIDNPYTQEDRASNNPPSGSHYPSVYVGSSQPSTVTVTDVDSSSSDSRDTPSDSNQSSFGGGVFIPSLPNTEKQDNNSSHGETTSSATQEDDDTTYVISPAVRGKIPFFNGLISDSGFFNFFNQAYAGSCSNPQLHVYSLSDFLSLAPTPLISTEIDSSASFYIDQSELNQVGISTNNIDQASYILTTSGCTTKMLRLVSGFLSAQDLSLESTIIANYFLSTLNLNVQNINMNSYVSLMKEVDKTPYSSTFNDAFTSIQNNYTQQFNETFSDVSLNDLLDAKPTILSADILSEPIDENDNFNFQIVTEHWNTNYDITYEWELDGVLQSNNANWTFSPTGNSKPNYTLNLKIGAKNSGDNNVDTSKPYHSFNIDINVNDSSAVTSPSFSLNAATNNPSSTRNINLDILTGVNLANCDSFSNFAFSEDGINPPVTFSGNCSTSTTQTESYSVTSPGDGLKTIYLWTKDINGNTSTPTSINLTIDENDQPVVTQSCATTVNQNQSYSCSPSVSDADVSDSHTWATDISHSCSWLTIDPTTGAISGTPNDNNVGNCTLAFKANDGLLDSTTQTVNVTVNNTQPTLSITNASINEDAGLSIIKSDANVASSEEGFGVYALDTSTVSSPSCHSNGSLTINTSNGEVSFTPSSNYNGTCYIKVTFDDQNASNNTTSSQFSLTVNAINDTPSISSSCSTSINTDSAYSCSSSLTDPDLSNPSDSHTWSFAATHTCSWATINSSTGQISGTPNNSDAGTCTLSYRTQDNAGSYSNTLSYTLSVNDVTAPNAPLVTHHTPSSGSPYINTTSISLSATSCSDTPYVLINEASQPLAGDSAWQSCSTTLGALSYTLSSGDGTKNLKAWAKDSAGNISLTSTDLTIQLDTSSPTPSISSPALNSLAQTGITLSGNCENGLTVNISGDVDSASTTTCSSGTFSKAVTFSTGDGSKTISISQTDLAGNIGSDSRSFLKDDTDPALTWTSPSDGSSFQQSLTVSGACETGLDYTISGSGVLSDITSTCSSGTYSKVVYLSSGDGSKVVTIAQTDPAGNTTTITKTFIRDEVLPAITQTTLASSVYTNTDQVTFGGACESGLDITAKLNSSTEATGISCSSGTWSYTVATQTSDASYAYSFEQTDDAGNVGTISATWTRDTVAPSISISSSSSVTSAADNVSFSGSCEVGLTTVQVSNAESSTTSCSSGSWNFTSTNQTTDSTYNYTFTLTDLAGNSSSTSGSWIRDTSGPNLTITSSQNTINTLDNADFSGTCEDGLDVVITLLPSTPENTFTCSGGTFNYTLSDQTTDGIRQYKFSQTNALSVSTEVTVSWTRDTVPPVFQASNFKINGSLTPTSSDSRDVSLDFIVQDTTSNITHLCLRSNFNVTPSATSSCWQDITSSPFNLSPGNSLNVTNISYSLGLSDGPYDIYVWAKDMAENISSLTNAGSGTTGTDTNSINLGMGSPSILSNLTVANTDSPSNPIQSSELQITTGQDVYIKWNLTDDNSIPADAIQLYFTTDDINYTLITSGGGLANTQGADCTISAQETGCYKWSSPTSQYFRIRVEVTDSSGFVTLFNSIPLNENDIELLAGNTEPGLGGSALSGFLFSALTGNTRFADRNSFVVASNGDIYFRDMHSGIIKINSATGLMDVFIPDTDLISGDGGAATSATLKAPLFIEISRDDQLYIYDYDRIRKVDLRAATPTITTVIGGGNQRDNSVSDPLDLEIAYPVDDPLTQDKRNNRMTNLFSLSPSGDLYFRIDGANPDVVHFDNSADQPGRIWKYSPSSDTVQSIILGGVGITDYPNLDISTCLQSFYAVIFNTNGSINHFQSAITHSGDFNGTETACTNTNKSAAARNNLVRFSPTTFQAELPSPTFPPGYDPVWLGMRRTGQDGKLYTINREAGLILKFDETANAGAGNWNTIAGTGTPGVCDDGTQALSCNIKALDVFVNQVGTVYFVDNGRIRMINPDGTVVTVAGQSGDYGDGGLPIDARISEASSFDYYIDGSDLKFVFADFSSSKIREFTVNTNIQTLAGDGSAVGGVTDGSSALSSPLQTLTNHIQTDLVIDQSSSSKNVFFTGGGGKLAKLNRSNGLWNLVGGDGATEYFSASDGDFAIGLDFQKGTINVQPTAYRPGFILLGLMERPYDSGTQTYTPKHAMFKELEISTEKVYHLSGILEEPETGTLCNDGDLSSSCNVPSSLTVNALASWDNINSKWLITNYSAKTILTFEPGASGEKGTLTVTDNNITAFSYDPSNNIVYYCATDGKLYKRDVTSSYETELSLTSDKMSCVGKALHFDSLNGKIYFIYQQNGLYGLASHSGI